MLYADKLSLPDAKLWELKHIKKWDLVFCLYPRTCTISKKLIWFKYCYKGIWLITGPGDPIKETYYIDKHEFILYKLKE